MYHYRPQWTKFSHTKPYCCTSLRNLSGFKVKYKVLRSSSAVNYILDMLPNSTPYAESDDASKKRTREELEEDKVRLQAFLLEKTL